MSTIQEFGENLAAFEDKVTQIENGLRAYLIVLSNQRADLIKLIDANYQASITEIELMIKAVKQLRGDNANAS